MRSDCARLRGRSGNELLRPWTQCVPSPEIRKARPQVSQKTRLECGSTTKCISLVLTLSLSLTSFVPQIPAELSCSCGIQDTCLFRIFVTNAVASIGNWVLRGVLVVQDGTRWYECLWGCCKAWLTVTVLLALRLMILGLKKHLLVLRWPADSDRVHRSPAVHDSCCCRHDRVAAKRLPQSR